MNIGEAIEKIRKQVGYSQKELAEKAGVAAPTLSQIENGKKQPNDNTKKKICKALDIPEPLLYIMAMEESDIPLAKRETYKLLFPALQNLAKEFVR